MDTVAAARKFEDLGVDAINLNRSPSTGLDALRAIRRAVRCELELYATSPALIIARGGAAITNIGARVAGTATGFRQDPFLIVVRTRFCRNR